MPGTDLNPIENRGDDIVLIPTETALEHAGDDIIAWITISYKQ